MKRRLAVLTASLLFKRELLEDYQRLPRPPPPPLLLERPPP
jgi:hypothetical protein